MKTSLETGYRQAVERYLAEACRAGEELPQKELYRAMAYSLSAGGKRLRPIFVLEFCRMCGGDWEKALPLAAAMEMVHTYSLIHDDLPCMDDDDLRRGRPTNHKVFGEAMAVLAGDGLLTEAFSQIAAAPLPAEVRIKAAAILAGCAGPRGMVGGQALDMKSRERACTEEEVLAIQSRKTGALIRAACQMGVLAGGGDEAALAAAGTFAEKLGLAFQIRDDLLDAIGSEQELGKATGVDGEKNTFLRLYGVDACQEMVERLTQEAVAALAVFPDNAALAELAERLTTRRS